MRKACVACALKHLGQARALLKEVRKGYPEHWAFAMGHLAEAEDELEELFPSLTSVVRSERKQLELSPDHSIDWKSLVGQVMVLTGYGITQKESIAVKILNFLRKWAPALLVSALSASVQGATIIAPSVSQGYVDAVAGQASAATVAASAAARVTAVERNQVVTWAQMQVLNSLQLTPLADGYVDFFKDQVGVDLALSSNQTWTSGRYAWSAPYTIVAGAPTNDLLLGYFFNDNAEDQVVSEFWSTYPLTTGPATSGFHSDDCRSGSGSFYFPGDQYGTYITEANPALGSNFTIAFWVKFASLTQGGIISMGNPDVSEYNQLWIQMTSEGRLVMASGYSGPAEVDQLVWRWSTNWAFCVFSLTNGLFENVYVNGEQVKTNCYWAPRGTPEGHVDVIAGPVIVGGVPPWAASSSTLIGNLDTLLVYTRGFTPDEASALYQAATFYDLEGYVSSNLSTSILRGGNMALVATNGPATLLNFTPTEGRLGVLVENDGSALVTNVDYKGYLSCDGGTNWVQAVFDTVMPYGTNTALNIVFSQVATITGGSNLLWKFETCNTNKSGYVYSVAAQAR